MSMMVDNDLLSIQQARILAEHASVARKKLADFPQERLDDLVEGVADAVAAQIDSLAAMSCEETDRGNPRDKAEKNRFVCGRVREALRGMRCVGPLSEDRGLGVQEIGVPLGVVAAAGPASGPVSATVCAALFALKSGNAIVFSPHPNAPKTMARVVDLMAAAAEARGMPRGGLARLDTVTKSGTAELFNHPAVSLILVTGVPGLLQTAQAAGKPLIYAGAGNGPAFIERSADIRRAVGHIVAGKSFDYGLAPSAEQSIVVDAPVADEAARELRAAGAYFMSEEEAGRLAAVLFRPDGRRRTGTIGVCAESLARRAGFAVPEATRLLVAERKYVSEADPYSNDLRAPVLALYVEDDWEHACEKCIELLLHEGRAHTLVIHSNNEEVVRLFALKKPVGRLLVNTSAAFGGTGAATHLFPSVILGSGSAGHGITAENVSPLHLIYRRTVGRGIENLEAGRTRAALAPRAVETPGPEQGRENEHARQIRAIRQMLAAAAENDPGR